MGKRTHHWVRIKPPTDDEIVILMNELTRVKIGGRWGSWLRIRKPSKDMLTILHLSKMVAVRRVRIFDVISGAIPQGFIVQDDVKPWHWWRFDAPSK